MTTKKPEHTHRWKKLAGFVDRGYQCLDCEIYGEEQVAKANTEGVRVLSRKLPSGVHNLGNRGKPRTTRATRKSTKKPKAH